MTRDTAITQARLALEKEGFSFRPEASFAELIPAEEWNKHLTAMKLSAPRWVITFPMTEPNHIRSEVSVSVDDVTGEVSEGHTV